MIEPHALVGDLRSALTRRQNELREGLARGLIDEAAFREQGEKAGAAFNLGVLEIVRQLRDQAKDDVADGCHRPLPKKERPQGS